MHTIVGLGNPGKAYEQTRHNIGWLVLRELLGRHAFPELTRSSRYSGFLGEGTLHGEPVGVLLPTTFMNNSGRSVSLYIKEKGSADSLIVVHDDVDLPFGQIRISFGRGAGGHNGVQSIIDGLGSKEFIRIRIGVAERGFFGGLKRPKADELADFVLKRMSASQLKKIHEIAAKVDTAMELILTKGTTIAMQESN